MNSENKKYIFWLDFVRVLSIFMVIIIHASNPLYNRWKDLPFANWMTGNVYNSFARVSVPLLFMLSGYLLLSRQESVGSFYIKRMQKVLVPLLIWSVIYLMWRSSYANYTFINAAKAMVIEILKGPVYYHFWFLYALLAIYLFVPVLRVFVHAADKTTILYFALIWLIFSPLLDAVENSYLNFAVSIDLGFFKEYIGYFYLGYVLGQLTISRRTAILSAVTYLAVTAYTIYATAAWSKVYSEYFGYYHNYLRLNLVVMSLSAFVALKYLGEQLGGRLGERSVRWLRHISASTFGVYLIHAMILAIIRKGMLGFQLTALSASPIFMVPLLALLVFLISYFIVSILQRIPFIRAMVPS